MAKQDYLPIESLFASDGLNPNPESDPRPMLHRAEVIFGVDVMTGHQFLVFGKAALQKIVASGTAENLQTVYIGLDQETDELEKLCALVQTIKGYYDYEGED